MFSFLVSAATASVVIFKRNFQPATSWMLVKKDVQHYLLRLLKIKTFLKGQRRQNLIQVFSNVLTKDVLKVIRVFQPLKSICLLESVKCM